MTVKLTIELPPEAKKWLYAHCGQPGTVANYRNVFEASIAALIDDISNEYDAEQIYSEDQKKLAEAEGLR